VSFYVFQGGDLGKGDTSSGETFMGRLVAEFLAFFSTA